MVSREMRWGPPPPEGAPRALAARARPGLALDAGTGLVSRAHRSPGLLDFLWGVPFLSKYFIEGQRVKVHVQVEAAAEAPSGGEGIEKPPSPSSIKRVGVRVAYAFTRNAS